MSDSKRIYVPEFVTISLVAERDGGSAEYVVTNEATGKYFLANRATVVFLDTLGRDQNVTDALLQSGIDPAQCKALLEQMMRFGVVVQRGATHKAPAPKAPIESKAISLRFDLIDAASITKRFEWLGRAAFSLPGALLWFIAIIAMGYALITNGDKARFALAQISSAGWQDFVRFAVLIVGLKVVHEMGHALAYRVMSLREGHDPGPIRMGISIFALTPFPFTDVTGAWRLRSRWRRAMIGAAGIYFELGATALLTLFWAQTGSDALQVTIFQVAIFTAATTIFFNFNPAVKLDGYYVLSDLTGQHNIAGRGSVAARQWLSRKLGAQVEKPARPYLAYWLFSYAYRWTLFAGIFWIFYSLDQRLAVPIFAVILMTLIGRPLVTSVKFARSNGAKNMNMFVSASLAAALIGLCFVPFQDRLLLDGRTTAFDTRFYYAGETAKVSLDPVTQHISLSNPDLTFQADDLALREAILANAARSVTGSAAEKSRLASDAASLSQLADTLADRLSRLQIEATADGLWDLRAAERYNGAWVAQQNDQPLAVLSRPAPLRVLLWLDQSRVEQGILDATDTIVTIRVTANTACEFEAQIAQALPSLVAQSEVFSLSAFPLGDPPPCLTAYANGASVVARLDTTPKSVFERGRRTVLRLLQNRLPGQNQNQNI